MIATKKQLHVLKKLSKTPYYKMMKQTAKKGKIVNCRRRCEVCDKQTFFYCSTCSDNVQSTVNPCFICICPLHNVDMDTKKQPISCLHRHSNGYSKKQNRKNKRPRL